MAKDDYHVLACRVLAYLYACLKASQQPNLQYLQYGTDDFPVGQSYWQYIFTHLFEEGLIEGVTLLPILGQSLKGVKITSELMITPKGIEYLQENSAMQKAKAFLKDLKAMVPGL